MTLSGHSNDSYLSKTKFRSRAGGHFYMSEEMPIPSNNGDFITVYKIIKAMMSSASEAELVDFFINCQ